MAIALDSTSQGVSSTGQVAYSISHTCTGSDLVLFVCVGVSLNTDILTSCTYNGVAMTLLDKVGGGGAGFYFNYVFYMVNPPTGAHNISTTTSAGSFHIIRGISYTGAKQTGIPDAGPTHAQDTTNTDITLSVTPSASGCWALFFVGGQRALSAGVGSTYRTGNGNTQWVVFDSNGVIAAGSPYAMHATAAAALYEAPFIFSFAPSASATNIKAINGLAKASVKSVNGLAIASVKSVNGLS